MPVPIVLPISEEDKTRLAGAATIVLKSPEGEALAKLTTPSFYEHRKEERATRTFGISADRGHPYIDMIFSSPDWLMGGKVEVLKRIKYNDGMDQWRLTPVELKAKFKEMGADAVFVFQL